MLGKFLRHAGGDLQPGISIGNRFALVRLV
jgi:hypothetical protein